MTEIETADGRKRSAGNAAQERFGLRQRWPSYHTKRKSISLTGKGREVLADHLADLLREGHPHAVALFGFTPKTVIYVRGPLQARALYCEISSLLQNPRLNRHARTSLHRVRDEVEAFHENQREDLKANEARLGGGGYGRGTFRPSLETFDLDVPLTDDDDFATMYSEWVLGKEGHFADDPLPGYADEAAPARKSRTE